MTDLFKWYNLIFYIPLAIGLLSVVVIAFSGVEHEVGAHIHADFHADADNDADSDNDGDNDGEAQNWFLGLLGIGRVPLTIIFMTLLLIFGGVGASLNTIQGPLMRLWKGFEWLCPWVSLTGATIATLFGTAFISRTVSRFMPTTETDSMKTVDLVGCYGIITLSCDKTHIGLAQLKNPKGDLYQVQCRSESPLGKGTAILTTEYDVTSKVFTVEVDPTSG